MAVQPGATLLAALTTLFAGLSSSGLSSKLVLGYLLNLETEQQSRLNLVSPGQFTLTNDGTAPTWVSGVGGAGGFTANGATINTGLGLLSSPSSTRLLSQNNVGCTIRIRSNAAANVWDCGESGGRFLFNSRSAGNTTQTRMPASATAATGAVTTDSTGIWQSNRIDAASIRIRVAKATVGSDIASTSAAFGNNAVRILGNLTLTSTRRTSSFFLHSSLSNSDADTLYDLIDAFDTAIGAS